MMAKGGRKRRKRRGSQATVPLSPFLVLSKCFDVFLGTSVLMEAAEGRKVEAKEEEEEEEEEESCHNI